MNVESNLGELEQIVEALDQKHDALSSGGAEVLPELQAVNKLYNRLRESTEGMRLTNPTYHFAAEFAEMGG
jgi:hypothetical protein